MKQFRVLLMISAMGAVMAHASNGLLLIGHSLKQLAVGGAVTANPMSPITSIANPAGLAFVDAQTDASLDFAFLNLDAHFAAAPSANAKSLKTFQLMPSLGMMAPTQNPRVRFGMAVAVVAGSGTDFSWPSLARSSSSDLQVIKIAPAMSYKITDKLAVGGAIHLNIGRVSLSNPGFGASTLPTAFAHGSEMVGVGMGLGAMYDIVPGKVQVGASYQSAANFPTAKYGSSTGNFSGKFDLPQQAALGVSVKPLDKLTVSLDWKWINYEDTLKHLYIFGPGLPVGGVDLGTNWKDQYVVALGAQYRVAKDMTLMAGYNHCTEPFSSTMMSKNILMPAIARNHYTIGLSYESDQRWSLGLVGIFTPKNTVTDGVTSVSSETTTLGFSATIRF